MQLSGRLLQGLSYAIVIAYVGGMAGLRWLNGDTSASLQPAATVSTVGPHDSDSGLTKVKAVKEPSAVVVDSKSNPELAALVKRINGGNGYISIEGDTLVLLEIMPDPLGNPVWAARLQRDYPGFFTLEHKLERVELGGDSSSFRSYILRGDSSFIKLVHFTIPEHPEEEDACWHPEPGDTAQVLSARIRSPRILMLPGIRIGMTRHQILRAILGDTIPTLLENIRAIQYFDALETSEGVLTFKADHLREVIIRTPNSVIPDEL